VSVLFVVGWSDGIVSERSREESVRPHAFFFLAEIGLRHSCEHVDLIILQRNYRIHTRMYVHRCTYPISISLTNKGVEIEMKSRQDFSNLISGCSDEMHL
jgi:hypothetical protein